MKKIIFLTTLILLFITACETENGKDKTNYSQYFSIATTQKVQFSPGNLQWSATNGGNTPTTHEVAGGATAAGTWRFALNQWEMIGFANGNVSSTYTGWIDLFGWGTSGYNNKYPYMTSTTATDYGNGNNNISGTNYDWGVYNAIYNPQTNTTDAPGTWRTLTNGEWMYLLEVRSTLSGIRYAKAMVNEVHGLIIVPDNWSSTIYKLKSNTGYIDNKVNASDWGKLEAAGCVFLPAAGYRIQTWLNDVGSYGSYWSSTKDSYDYAYYLYFGSNRFNPSYNCERRSCLSVRLVKDVE